MSDSRFMTRDRWLVLTGLLISAVLAWLVIERLDWPVFWAALERVEVVPLALAVPALIGGVVLRGLRWMLIAMGRPRHRLDFLRATSIGYLGNTILPLRLGEILRVFAICRLTEIPVATAMASTVADRLLDAIMLGVLLLIVMAALGAVVVPLEVNAVDLVVVAAGFVAVVVAMAWGRRWRRPMGRLVRGIPGRTGYIIFLFYIDMVPVFIKLLQLKSMTVTASLTVLATVADLLALWLVMTAFGWSMPIMAAVTVMVFLNIGGLVPAAPGYIGIFQVACIFALNLFGVAEAEAVAFSVVLQLLIVILLIIIGAMAVISCDDRLGPRHKAMGAKSREAAG